MADEFRWAPCTKDPEETKPVALSLFGLCASFWEPNEEKQEGDIVWPVVTDADGNVSGIGYCFEAGATGRTGPKQPKFASGDGTTASVALDATLPKLDGSVPWICRAPGAGGISAVTLDATPSEVSPAGLVVSGIVVNENTKLFVDYQAGTLDEDYEVAFRFIIAGRLRIGRQLVRVRKE
jgi:hypothetical protein